MFSRGVSILVTNVSQTRAPEGHLLQETEYLRLWWGGGNIIVPSLDRFGGSLEANKGSKCILLCTWENPETLFLS